MPVSVVVLVLLPLVTTPVVDSLAIPLPFTAADALATPLPLPAAAVPLLDTPNNGYISIISIASCHHQHPVLRHMALWK